MQQTASTIRPGPGRALVSLAAAASMLAGTLASCGGSGAASASVVPSASVVASPSAISSGSEFSIVSTLQGLTELPHRIHWEATPGGSASDVEEVDFLIDDQLAWVEHNPPYFYADDANWLVTSFLSPGAHTFVTKAIATDDRTAIETVTATVEAAPQPPPDLAGRWSRTIVAGPASFDLPLGVWHVTINTIGWLFDDPHGGGQNQDATYPAVGKVQIQGAIIEPPLGEYDRGGFFCGDPVDPDDDFSYSVSADGSQLTLTAAAPVCYQGLIEGMWARNP
jgi:hypothetical protein